MKIHHHSAAVLIVAEDGTRLFAERKVDLPKPKAFDKGLCLIGGNWVGPKAAGDQGPRATLLRELEEELDLAREDVVRRDRELGEILNIEPGRRVVKGVGHVSAEDRKALSEIVIAIKERLERFGDFRVRVAEGLFSPGSNALFDPTKEGPGMTFLNSVFVAKLPEEVFARIERLQKKYGSLSNEAQTEVFSAAQTHREAVHGAWGYDTIVRDFFASRKVGGWQFKITPGVIVAYLAVGQPTTYAGYKELGIEYAIDPTREE